MNSQLITASASNCLAAPGLIGNAFIPADVDRIADYDAKVFASPDDRYRLGGKDPKPGQGLVDFANGIDCSGWNETLSMFITHGILSRAGFPDGSYLQARWLQSAGFKYHEIKCASDYQEAVSSAIFNLYAMGFHFPNGRNGDATGHVWPIVHDHADDSYGGHGPGLQAILNPWFVAHCDLIVLIGPLLITQDWFNPALNPYLPLPENDANPKET